MKENQKNDHFGENPKRDSTKNGISKTNKNADSSKKASTADSLKSRQGYKTKKNN